MTMNPYTRLLQRAKNFAWSVKNPHRRSMWMYPKNRLSERWQLSDLYERARAADQLGYDVVLKPGDDGLTVQYVKRPDVPWDWA